MKIEKLKVNVGLTLNLGNYESARVDVGAEATLGPEDTVIEDAYRRLFEMCDVEIKQQISGVNSELANRYRSAHNQR